MDHALELRIRVSPVRTAGRDLRVARAERLSTHLTFEYSESVHQDVLVVADRAGGLHLAAAWALAMRSRHTLVHLPIRGHRPSTADTGAGTGRPLDVVLAPSSLRFRPTDWKAVRNAIGAGSAGGAGAVRTLRLPSLAREFPESDDAGWERTRHREYRSHLRFTITAETLVVTGDAAAFRYSGSFVRSLVEELPSEAVRYPKYRHQCVEMWDTDTSQWSYRRRRPGVGAGLHLVYAAAGWPPERAVRAVRATRGPADVA